MGRSAFVDESIRTGPPGYYFLAVVVIDPADLDGIRRSVRAVIPPRQRRFRWSDESRDRRERMLRLLIGLSLQTTVYRADLVIGARQDRARALCLEAAAWDLPLAGVTDLVIESRQEHGDRRDRQTLVRAQKSKRAPTDLAYSFVRPRDEPLLWIPDCYAGAVSLREAGLDHPLAPLVERLEVEIRLVRR